MLNFSAMPHKRLTTIFYKKNALPLNLFVILSCICFPSCDHKSEELKPLSFNSPPVKPKVASLHIPDICPTAAGFSIHDIYAVHDNMKMEKGSIHIDTDRDGLSDSTEQSLIASRGVNQRLSDANNDGYSDLIVVGAGFSPEEQRNLHLCEMRTQDTDLDGLTDCEEDNILHTDSLISDTDNDGIIDGIEVRFGTSPTQAGDGFQDIDGDNIDNYSEIKANTPIVESNTETMTLHALKYNMKNYKNSSGDECTNFILSNIPLFKISAGNYIDLWIVERNAQMQTRTSRIYIVIPYSSTDITLEKKYDAFDKKTN